MRDVEGPVDRHREADPDVARSAAAEVAIEVLMPTTRPSRSTSGPPELPGLIDASVWIMASMVAPRSSALTTPEVTVPLRLSGDPTAITGRPIRRSALTSRAAQGHLASARSTAMSSSASLPTTSAVTVRPEESTSRTLLALDTTWWLVST